MTYTQRPAKLRSANLSPKRSLMESDLSEGLGGGFPALVAGDLKEKRSGWIRRLITASGKLLRD